MASICSAIYVGEAAQRGVLDLRTLGSGQGVGELGRIPRRPSACLGEPFGQPPDQRSGIRFELDLDLAPRKQSVLHRSVDLVVGELRADTLMLGFADPITRAFRANSGHVDQFFAQPKPRQQLLQLGGRRIREGGPDLDASFGGRNLELPAGVVVAIPSPQHDPVGLQVVVGGVVVRALQVDGGAVDLPAVDQVV